MKSREFDKKIKTKVVNAENTMPPSGLWDLEKNWRNILEGLNQNKGKALYWSLAMAASISLVCAAGLSFHNTWEPEPIRQMVSISSKAPLVNEMIIQRIPTPIESVAPKKMAALKSLNHEEISKMVAPALLIKSSLDILPIQESINQRTVSAPVRPDFKLQLSTKQWSISPELYFKKPIDSSDLLDHAGFSLEPRLFFHRAGYTESGNDTRLTGAVFINAVIGKENTKQPWLLKVGYAPLQTTKNDLLRSAFKINYQLQLRKNWFIGPELILTKGFKKAYPALTVSFG